MGMDKGNSVLYYWQEPHLINDWFINIVVEGGTQQIYFLKGGYLIETQELRTETFPRFLYFNK